MVARASVAEIIVGNRPLLVITQTPEVQEEIQGTLELLRKAGGLKPPRSRLPATINRLHRRTAPCTSDGLHRPRAAKAAEARYGRQRRRNGHGRNGGNVLITRRVGRARRVPPTSCWWDSPTMLRTVPVGPPYNLFYTYTTRRGVFHETV